MVDLRLNSSKNERLLLSRVYSADHLTNWYERHFNFIGYIDVGDGF